MAIRLSDLLKRISPDIEKVVEGTRHGAVVARASANFRILEAPAFSSFLWR